MTGDTACAPALRRRLLNGSGAKASTPWWLNCFDNGSDDWASKAPRTAELRLRRGSQGFETSRPMGFGAACMPRLRSRKNGFFWPPFKLTSKKIRRQEGRLQPTAHTPLSRLLPPKSLNTTFARRQREKTRHYQPTLEIPLLYGHEGNDAHTAPALGDEFRGRGVHFALGPVAGPLGRVARCTVVLVRVRVVVVAASSNEPS